MSRLINSVRNKVAEINRARQAAIQAEQAAEIARMQIKAQSDANAKAKDEEVKKDQADMIRNVAIVFTVVIVVVVVAFVISNKSKKQ